MALMLCSSDSHTYEPADLWTTRLPKNLRHAGLHWRFLDGGAHGALVTAATTMTSEQAAKGYVTTSRPLGPDDNPLVGGVDERIKALDSDGIHMEVLCANIGMNIFNMRDQELAAAHATVYNDYMGETFAKRPDRFISLAAVPILDIEWALKEIDRAAKLGLRGVMLPIMVPDTYALEKYDPLWASLQEHAMPVTFHAATGFDAHGAGLERQVPRRSMSAKTDRERHAAHAMYGVEYSYIPQNLVATLVGSGVCARYPKLMIVSAENHAHWLAGLMGSMDQAWARMIGEKKALIGFHGDDVVPGPSLPMKDMFSINNDWPYELKPSDYVRRQVRLTFMDDRSAIACRAASGAETLMWAADFPHPESTYPDSGKITDQLFANVSQADRDAIVAGNLAKLYGFEPRPAH